MSSAAKIPPREAFNEGDGLWVIADSAHSKWTQKLDWYLNFLISREAVHKPAALPIELLRVIEEWKCDIPAVEVPAAAAVLMGCDKLLPAHQVLRIQYDGDAKAWSERAVETAKALKTTSVRVFLPQGVSAEKAALAWNKWTSCRVHFVEEPEAWNFSVG